MAAMDKHSISTAMSITLLVLLLCFLRASADLERFKHPVKEDGSLSLLVVGDWGRKGRYNQSQVAHQMGKVGERLKIDFVVSTGDNFYDDGLSSIDDPQFEDSFSKIYTATSLQQQWYNVLGNHDYRGNVEAQLSPRSDARWLCRRSFIVDTETAEFFFVDTTPFVDKYFKRPNKHRYDWRGVLPRDKYVSDLLEDLQLSLRESVAQWKIVIGHHTVKSIGHHRATKELVNQLLPILEAERVDMYINGHDHCLEHISSSTSPIQFLTSGGGSKAWKGDIDRLNMDGLKFYYDGQGFLSMQLTQTEAKIMFHDVSGKVLHDFLVSKELYSTF